MPRKFGKWNKEALMDAVKKAGVFVLVGLAVFSAFSFSRYRLTRTLYHERSANTQLLMEQIALNLDESLDEKMDSLAHFALFFEQEGFTTLEDALNFLVTVRQTSEEEILKLYLVDSKSRCHSLDETSFRWRNTDLLASGQSGCLLSTEENSISSSQMMYFLRPFSAPIRLDGCTVTHMVMATTMEVVDKFFDVAYYGQGSTSFILNANGSQVYRSSGNDTDIGQTYNLLKALEAAEYDYGASLEQLKADIAARASGCIHIVLKGQPYYLAYEPLSANDWMAVMLIEEDHIAGASAGFVSSMTVSIALIAIIAVVAIVGAVIAATRSANRRLAAAAEAERRANDAKTQFLSAMSHDIRTPMNAIIGMTDLAARNIDNRDCALDYLSKVRMSSDHLLTLINDVLDISKVESGQMHMSPSLFSLEDEVKRLVEIITPQIREKNQEFICHVRGLENKMVWADKLRINQVMLNILSNAVKYTQPGGRIRLDIIGAPNARSQELFQVVYRVSDNGIGMSEEFQKNMYNAFSREDNAPKRDIQGSGLGLAICKQLVDLMGGTIECKSAPGVGTTFAVSMMLKRSPDREAAAHTADPEAGEGESLAGMRVLVAEDNDFNWEIAAAVLQMQGIDTLRAENGQICVDMIQAAGDQEYDMILMDIQMPKLNGYEATQAIRSSRRTYLRQIPIVAMTADAFAEDIQRCLKVGMNAHIAKPIDVDSLLAVLKDVKSGRLPQER